MIEDTMARFGEQFDWQPHIENATQFGSYKQYIVCGMGGSNLGSWLIQQYGSVTNVILHRDYGLPNLSDNILKESLIILSSYSGNTEEAIDASRVAIERGLSVACVTTGGTLLNLAQDHNLPYVRMPDMGLQPRMAIGLSMLGIVRLMQHIELEESIRTGGKAVDPMMSRSEGYRIAEALRNKIPIVYSSAANAPLAYIWKIKFNETAKIPAFYNVFPECCHNELCGFDVVDATHQLSKNLHALFLEDDTDHPRIQKRMHIMGDILHEKGITVEHINLLGDTQSMGRQGFEKAFYTAVLADWVSLLLAQHYGVPGLEVPLVEEFKRRMAQ